MLPSMTVTRRMNLYEPLHSTLATNVGVEKTKRAIFDDETYGWCWMTIWGALTLTFYELISRLMLFSVHEHNWSGSSLRSLQCILRAWRKTFDDTCYIKWGSYNSFIELVTIVWHQALDIHVKTWDPLWVTEWFSVFYMDNHNNLYRTSNLINTSPSGPQG